METTNNIEQKVNNNLTLLGQPSLWKVPCPPLEYKITIKLLQFN